MITNESGTSEPKQGIKGIWIPGEVAFNKDLNFTDMFTWWLVDSLDCTENHCWASNEFLSNRIGVNKTSVSNSIKKLKKFGYIKQIGKIVEGRYRILAKDESFYIKYKYLIDDYNKCLTENCNTVLQKTVRQPYNKLQDINNIDIENIENVLSKDKTTFSLENVKNNHSDYSKQYFENKEKKNKLDNIEMTSGALRIIESWNSKGKPFTEHNINKETETLKRIIVKIQKTLEKHSIDEIRQSICNYHKWAIHQFSKFHKNKPGYDVKSLEYFFGFNTYYRNRIEKNNPNLSIESWFDESLKGYDYLMTEHGTLREDKYPEITESLKDRWCEHFDIDSKELTVDDENNFRKAAIFVNDFFDKNENSFEMKNARDYLKPKFCEFVFETIKKYHGKKNNITTGLLCQLWFYDSQLYEFLKETNRLS